MKINYITAGRYNYNYNPKTDKLQKTNNNTDSSTQTAPASTKRHKKPWDYGPKALILEKLDPETGRRFKTGEFIHGNNNPKSLGKYASLGCIRMDNEVIKQIAKDAKRGDLVLIQ